MKSVADTISIDALLTGPLSTISEGRKSYVLVLVIITPNVKGTLELIWLPGSNMELHKLLKNYERNWTFSIYTYHT